MRRMTVDELRREVDHAAPIQAETESSGVRLIRASGVRMTAVRWLWNGWLAQGKLQLLAGPPGLGKTTISTSIAAAVTVGGMWPDGTRAPVGSVLIWSAEDDISDTLVPRLVDAGADLDRVRFVTSSAGSFDPATEMAALQREAVSMPDLRLLILDPIVSAVAGDSHRANDVRRALQPVVDFARATGAAVLGITHFSKGAGGKAPIERVIGSQAFGALARLVLVAVQEPGEDGRRLLVRAKSNIGPDGGGISYSIEQVPVSGAEPIRATRIQWHEQVEGHAADLLAVADSTPGARSVLDDAISFLHDQLAAGAVPAKRVQESADAQGISKASLRRAEAALRVVKTKGGFNGGWIWRLPTEDVHEGAQGS
ncbi:MAG: AAA family ATPase [Burkholderiaceae bacterium]